MTGKETKGGDKVKGDFQETRYGYCECGCNQRTMISPRNDKRRGWVKGEPRKYLFGHHIGFGKNSPGWRGGRSVIKNGNLKYAMLHIPGHPRSNCRGYVFEHIVVAEKAFGKYLP